MRTITTSKGQTFPVDYCGVGYMGMLKMQVHDARRLCEVAADLDGCKTITYDSGTEQETFTGYTELRRAEYVTDGEYVILLAKRGANDGEL